MHTPDVGLGRAAAALVTQGRPRRATHFAIPPSGSPRYLIPLRPALATEAALRTFISSGTTRSRTLRRTGAVLARIGAARLAPGAVALGGSGTFLRYLETLLGQDLIASIHLGPPRANRKPVLQLMDLRGRSVAFAKLGMNDLTCKRVRTEAAALQLLASESTPGLVVPSVLAAGQWEGLDYLVMKPVSTDTGLPSTRELRSRATGALVAAFPTSWITLAESPWWERIMTDLSQCSETGEAVALRDAAARIFREHGSTPVLSGAGHGDFSPWNVCAHPDHLVVWDWERFTPDVPVGWDEFHFLFNVNPNLLTDMSVRTPEAAGPLPASELQPYRKLSIATYLLSRGVNYIVDGQREAGSRRGPLHDWLIPTLNRYSGVVQV